MARYDKDLNASAGEPIDVLHLLAELGRSASGDSRRTDAVARFLAGAEGWEQAAQQLGGAFAECEQGRVDDDTRGGDR